MKKSFTAVATRTPPNRYIVQWTCCSNAAPEKLKAKIAQLLEEGDG
jgi:hypothetical protein